MKRLVLMTATAIFVTGCATASQPGAMVPEVAESSVIDGQSKLYQSVSMGDVTGGKKTNPLWTSEVSNEDFAEALSQSFAAHAMLSTDQGNYRLDAEMLKLKQPALGLDMSVTSNVKYTLTEVSSGKVVMEETVSKKYTAKMSDAFVGVKRLQLANEGSIKGNIASLIEMMVNKFDGKTMPMAMSLSSSNNG